MHPRARTASRVLQRRELLVHRSPRRRLLVRSLVIGLLRGHAALHRGGVGAIGLVERLALLVLGGRLLGRRLLAAFELVCVDAVGRLVRVRVRVRVRVSRIRVRVRVRVRMCASCENKVVAEQAAEAGTASPTPRRRSRGSAARAARWRRQWRSAPRPPAPRAAPAAWQRGCCVAAESPCLRTGPPATRRPPPQQRPRRTVTAPLQ